MPIGSRHTQVYFPSRYRLPLRAGIASPAVEGRARAPASFDNDDDRPIRNGRGWLPFSLYGKRRPCFITP